MSDKIMDEDKLIDIFEKSLNAAEDLEKYELERIDLMKKTNALEKRLKNIELDIKHSVYFSKEYKNETQRKIMCELKLREHEEYQSILKKYEELTYKLEWVKAKSTGLKVRIKIYNSIMKRYEPY